MSTSPWPREPDDRIREAFAAGERPSAVLRRIRAGTLELSPNRVPLVRRTIVLLLALVIAAGCGGDGDDDDATTAATASTGTTAEGTVAVTADDIPAPGDPCDGNDYGEAVEWPPNLDCDDEAGEVVAAGQKCTRYVEITTLAQKLECETGQKRGRGKWIIYDPSAPDTANPSVPIKPVQEGDPCVPGQELPPGYVCE